MLPSPWSNKFISSNCSFVNLHFLYLLVMLLILLYWRSLYLLSDFFYCKIALFYDDYIIILYLILVCQQKIIFFHIVFLLFLIINLNFSIIPLFLNIFEMNLIRNLIIKITISQKETAKQRLDSIIKNISLKKNFKNAINRNRNFKNYKSLIIIKKCLKK